MRLLLGSGGFRTDERRAFLASEMRAHFGQVERVLFVPYALADHERYVALMVEKGLHAGYALDGIHRHADPVRAVREAPAIYIGGGNTFRLVDELQRRGLIEPLRERARAGVPFMGVSAGANVACPTLKTTNDMPIVQPRSFETLALVPFQINPHYYSGSIHFAHEGGFQEHFGETRDDRIAEFHEMNETPVIGLFEGAALRVREGEVTLAGGRARLFRRGAAAVDLEDGARVEGLLGAGAGSRATRT